MRIRGHSWPPISSIGGLQLDLSLWDTGRQSSTWRKEGVQFLFRSFTEEETCYEIQYGLNETTFTVDDGKGYYCEGNIGNSGI